MHSWLCHEQEGKQKHHSSLLSSFEQACRSHDCCQACCKESSRLVTSRNGCCTCLLGIVQKAHDAVTGVLAKASLCRVVLQMILQAETDLLSSMPAISVLSLESMGMGYHAVLEYEDSC